MWPSLPQLKQRLLQGSFFTGLVWSRSIGWGAGGTVAAEGLEKEEEEEEAAAVEVTTGGEWNKDSLVVAAFSWVEDGVDFLCGPGACGSSLHVQQDKQDIAVLIQELGLSHTEVEGTFSFEAV